MEVIDTHARTPWLYFTMRLTVLEELHCHDAYCHMARSLVFVVAACAHRLG